MCFLFRINQVEIEMTNSGSRFQHNVCARKLLSAVYAEQATFINLELFHQQRAMPANNDSNYCSL